MTNISRRNALQGLAAASLTAIPAAALAAAPSQADAALQALADELRAIEAVQHAMLTGSAEDVDLEPPYVALENRRQEVLDLIETTAATGLTGLHAKAQVILTPTIADCDWDAARFAASLAADIVGLVERGA